VIDALGLSDVRRETRAAFAAVDAAREIISRGVDVSRIASKGERDIVTQADTEAEEAIRRLLVETLGFPVVGEELGGAAPAGGKPFWLVDPLCGTKNFASGIPLYCTNLALVENGRVSVAVIGDCSRQEICFAEAGRGAWAIQGGSRQPLLAVPDSEVIVVEDVKAHEPRRGHVARLMAAAFTADRWDFRCLSTSVGLAYLAAGRISAYFLIYSRAVHAAAGALLAAEAGATVTDMLGQPWTIGSDSLLAAATPHLHADLLELALATRH